MSHRHKIKHPRPKDVDAFLKDLKKKIKKRGTRFYRKHRTHAENTLNTLLKDNHIAGTSSEMFWRLKGIVVLIGKEVLYL
jgi:hypothetical protein